MIAYSFIWIIYKIDQLFHKYVLKFLLGEAEFRQHLAIWHVLIKLPVIFIFAVQNHFSECLDYFRSIVEIGVSAKQNHMFEEIIGGGYVAALA